MCLEHYPNPPPLPPKKTYYSKSNSPAYEQDEGQKSCDEILLLL